MSAQNTSSSWSGTPDVIDAAGLRRKALNALMRERVPAKYAYSDAGRVPQIDDGAHAGSGVFISGNPGIGKTYAATALARLHIDAFVTTSPHPVHGGEVFPGTAISWVTAPRFMCRIRSTMNRRTGDTALDVMEEYCRATVLVFDDLGAEKATDYAAEAVYDLLSDRINHERFTIVTSNLGIKEIAEWRPGIASRLGEFHRVRLPDVDRRLAK